MCNKRCKFQISINYSLGRIIDSLIDTLYELAEEKEAKSKPPPPAASSGSSTGDVSALDLKVRSLRTRLRNAENTTSTLAKQQKDVEVKIKLNHQEVSMAAHSFFILTISKHFLTFYAL